VTTNLRQSQHNRRVRNRAAGRLNGTNPVAESAGAIVVGGLIMPELREIHNRGRERYAQPEHPTVISALSETEEMTRSQTHVAQQLCKTEESDPLAAERDELIVEHLPTVRFIARRIHEGLPEHVLIEDLFSAGAVGLMDAAKRFDPSKGVKFSTFAQLRIRGAILDSLRVLDWAPRELRRKGRAVKQTVGDLTARFQRAPSEAEIAGELGIGLTDYHLLLGELNGLEVGSLHEERWDDSGEEELAYIHTALEEDPLFRCLAGETRQRLTEAVDALPERERLVMNLYYYEELTMMEISSVLGVAASRASQIHMSAVRRLRTMLADLNIPNRRATPSDHVASLPARLDPRRQGNGVRIVC
jgi:RNA polymerase sigma factor for flagellar operon FliA